MTLTKNLTKAINDSFSNDLAEVENLLNKAKGRVTRWGKYIIEVEGYKGSTTMEHIANKFLDHYKAHKEKSPYHYKISKRLGTINRETEELLWKSPLATRISYFVRDFLFQPIIRIRVDENIDFNDDWDSW